MEKEWYVVNTYSGHENKVKEKLEMRASTMGMEDYIFRVVVPEQKEIEIKDGKEKEKIKKMFPGYILVEMIMNDEAWFIVRNTPGVTGFIGSSGKGAKPTPLQPFEVDQILGNMGMTRLEVDSDLKEGELVKGFAPEVAWVTEGGSNKLEERHCIRPTSETMFSDYYSSHIRSYKLRSGDSCSLNEDLDKSD